MKQYMYQNPELSIDERVKDLMGRMTLEQKTQQLTCSMVTGMPDSKNFKNGIGEVIIFAGSPPAREIAALIRMTQDMVMEQTEFHIPALVHAEALSGPMVSECAVFPTSLSLGATFSPELVKDMGDRIREQMVNIGIRQALSPVLDLVRDFRWGRTSEDYGSDPTHVSEMACAYISGLQSDDLKNGVAATAKHFIGYSMTEGGINGTRTQTDWRDLRENFAKPFEAAIHKANLKSVMNSYSEYDGELICGSKRILNDLLRDDLGFEGVVVSDYTSIENLVEKCPIEETAAGAGAHCLKAGLDIELPNPYGYGETLAEAVKNHEIEEAYVDRALERILRLKFELGLFEKPYGAFTEMDNSENDKQSEAVSRKVMTLTKNDGILPIKDRNTKIAIIGPTGNNLIMLNGSYSYPANEEMFMAIMSTGMMGMEGIDIEGDTFVVSEEKTDQLPDFAAEVDANIRKQHPGVKTIYEAVKELYPNTTYTTGCHIVKETEIDIEGAVKAAKSADIVIAAVGGKIGMMVECTAGEGRDNIDITLPGNQGELVRAVYEANPNVVIVHTDNKPLVDPFIYKNVPAILEAWLPGIYGGNAIADTVAGINNPGGKLPVDIPRHVGQTPVYYYQHTGCRSDAGLRSINPDGYGTMTCAAQLPFGYGLSYTKFTYSNGTLDVNESEDVPVITVSVDVSNTGTIDGDEVVQLYGVDKVASIIRPQKELIGFRRVSLRAGETKRVTLTFRIDQLAFMNMEQEWVVEQGTFHFYVGKGCNEPVYETDYIQNKTLKIDHKKRGFFAETTVG